MSNKTDKSFTLLCLFDYKATTGFATVSHNIIRSLQQYFGKNIYLNIVAVNYFGESYQANNGRLSVWPASLIDGKKDPFGRNEFLRILKHGHFDGIFIINDPGVILPIVPVLKDINNEKRKANRKQFKSIFYFPIDGPITAKQLEGIDYFDVIVAYTEYAKAEVCKAYPSLKSKIKVIYHGVNHDDFNVLDQRQAAEFREAYFGKENSNKVIIGNINRNQPRKDIPTTLFAFVEYRKMYCQNSFLYLHMNPDDELGYKLRSIAQQLGLIEGTDFMFPPQDLIDNHPEPGYLSCIYNALDMFVTTTTGEGFGLTILEAMACGVPTIAPMHTSIEEIGRGGRIYFADELRPHANHFDNMIRFQCEPLQIAELMNEAYTNKELTKKKVELSLDFTDELDWNIVNSQWLSVFEKLFQ